MDADPVDASAATSQLDTKALSAAKITADDPMIGREVIGQYRIEKKIGSGGMGTVYLAQQTTVQRPAVIKVLKPQAAGKLDLPARFAIEARAASNLNHPNIVTVYNYGQMDDGTLFLAMEYLDGETLESRITRSGPLPVDRAVHVASQIARALGEAHAHGVVHRDLKPANIMLVARDGDPDFVKVLDFGIAKLDDAAVTSAGYVVGTPRYMSPEQLLGQALDRRSDIYSAGIVLYEMLAGVTPFSSETPIGWVRQHVDAVPKPPSAAGKGLKIPVAVERVVMRTIAKKPGDRPPSMEMLALDLVAALNAPTEPPWWRRAARVIAKGVGRAVVASVRFFVAFVRAFGSRGAKLARSIRSGATRGTRRAGSATWRSARRIAAITARSIRAVGSGLRRLAGFVVGGLSRAARAAWSGTARAARATGTGVRRFVLVPPERFGRWLVATRRRRTIAIVTVMLGVAGAVVAEVPTLREGLFGKAEIDVFGNSPKAKVTKPRHSGSTHAPAREKSR
ncbi:MAG TPA: serine/threonine-protein kinase [Gaiellaceae bacterium]|nr:serine/threonine-protein kinase [Gaiellaceae bacterium]